MPHFGVPRRMFRPFLFGAGPSFVALLTRRRSVGAREPRSGRDNPDRGLRFLWAATGASAAGVRVGRVWPGG